MPVSSPDFLSNTSRSDLHHEPVALRFVRIHLRRKQRPARRGDRRGNTLGAGPSRLELSGLLCAEIRFHGSPRLKQAAAPTTPDMQTARCASLENLQALVACRDGSSRGSGASSLATKGRALVGCHHDGIRGCMGDPRVARRPDMARGLLGSGANPTCRLCPLEHATRRLPSLREENSVSAAHRTAAGMRALRAGVLHAHRRKTVSLWVERSLEREDGLVALTTASEAPVEREEQGQAVEYRTPVPFWRRLQIHHLAADAALSDSRAAPREEPGTKPFGVIVDPHAKISGQRGIIRTRCLAIRVTIHECRRQTALIGGIAKDFDCSHFWTPVMLLPEPLSKRCANKIS